MNSSKRARALGRASFPENQNDEKLGKGGSAVGEDAVDNTSQKDDPLLELEGCGANDHQPPAGAGKVARPAGLSALQVTYYQIIRIFSIFDSKSQPLLLQLSAIGKKTKRILDHGRILYLRDLGFDAFAVRYCSSDLSPECHAIIARNLAIPGPVSASESAAS